MGTMTTMILRPLAIAVVAVWMVLIFPPALVHDPTAAGLLKAMLIVIGGYFIVLAALSSYALCVRKDS